MNSVYNKYKKHDTNQNVDKSNLIYPRLISPYIPKKNTSNYKESIAMASFNKYNFSKITKKALGYGIKDSKIRHKSNSGIRKIYANNKNNLTRNERDYQLYNYDNKSLNEISSYNSLINLWNEFCVMDTYKNLFNMILNKLSEEDKEDICSKEIKEFVELKKNINSLKKEIKSRKKTLGKINELNLQLGESFMKDGNNIDNEIIKDISDEIKNLRLYTVNVCYKMKKIKNKIYEGYLYGKYDLNSISEKFGFDKDYLIKMKEEMLFLKEGYIKHFFNLNNDFSPFLMNASEKISSSNGEPDIHIVPISSELKENIKQCNYLIYQELIYYQNSKINSQFDKVISPRRIYNKIINFNHKNMNFYDENNDIYRNKPFQSKKIENNFIEDKHNNYNNSREFNEQKYNIGEKNKNIQDESILFEEKGINIRDILGETNTKYNNPNIKNDIKMYSKNMDKFSESRTSKKSDLMSNNSNKKSNGSLCRYSYKHFKVMIFNNYINYFNDNYYKEYFKKIPEQEISMFNLQDNILSSLLNGIAPFLLLVKDENDIIFGMCSFNYIYHKNKLKIKINHLSAITDFNEMDYKGNLKIIYGNLINYIINQFYFGEMFIEYSKNNKNEEIYNIFINNFSFVEKTINIKKNQNESNGGDEISNNENNKLNFLLYRNKKQINESIKDSLTSFFGNNLFHFFDSILLTNKDKINSNNNYQSSDINDLKYSDSDLFINIVAINNLFKIKNNINITNSYQRITSLENLIKIFIQNNINNDEIPLSVAENRFDIVSFIFNKIINDILRNTSKIINNYNIFNSSSFLDEKTGVSYNFMNVEKAYLLYDEKNDINFYIIDNNSYAIFFTQISNNETKNFLFKKNLYLQINEIYKELISNKKIDVLYNKTIWIPCFNVYRHFKCLINNSNFTVHEYVRISNKIINLSKIRKKELNRTYGLLFNKNINSFLMEPEKNNDIILDNDFIIGVINNSSFFNKTKNNKNEVSSIIKDKEKEIPSNYSIKSEDEKEKNNEFNKSENSKKTQSKTVKGSLNNSDYPNIVFLNYISKNDFIK